MTQKTIEPPKIDEAVQCLVRQHLSDSDKLWFISRWCAEPLPHRAVHANHPDRDAHADIPEAYAVVKNKQADCGIVVWRLDRGKWTANGSARWLIAELLERLDAIADLSRLPGLCNCESDLARAAFREAARVQSARKE